MLFNQTAEYALRAMAFLARFTPDVLVSSDDIAAAAHIPGPFVPKVLRPLINVGLVAARRGRGRGVRLARLPSEISFEEILAASGALPDPDRCAFGHGSCNPLDPCPLHPTWTRLKESVDRWARETTLADVGEDLPLPGMR